MSTDSAHDAFPQPPADLASLSHLLRWRVATTPEWPAFRFRDTERGGSVEGAWRTWTWKTFGEEADSLAAALVELGLRAGECVAIAATTSIEWLLADYAVMHAGGVTTSIYPTSLSKDVEHILTHSHARIAFVEGHHQLAILLAMRERLPDLRHVIVFDADAAKSAHDPATRAGDDPAQHHMGPR